MHHLPQAVPALGVPAGPVAYFVGTLFQFFEQFKTIARIQRTEVVRDSPGHRSFELSNASGDSPAATVDRRRGGALQALVPSGRSGIIVIPYDRRGSTRWQMYWSGTWMMMSSSS